MPKTFPSNSAFYVLITLASFTLSATVYYLNTPWIFPLDDAYIVIDNAQTLLLGGVDDSYQQPALVGTTSAVHLLFVAVLGLVFELEIAAFAAAALFAALYVTGLARLLLQISQSRWVAIGATCIALFTSYGFRQLYGGLETGLAMAAVVWSLSLMVSHSHIALPILCGIMPFIRPELAALSLSILVWRWYKKGFDLRLIFQDIALFCLGFLPWIFWYYLSTGHVAPQTGSAKIAYFAEASLPWRTRLVAVTMVIWESTLASILLGLVFLWRLPFAVPAIFFSCALLGAYFLFLPAALGHNSARYLHLLLPIGLAGYIAIISRFSSSTRLSLLVLFGIIVFLSPPNSDRFLLGRPFVAEDGRTTAAWATQNLVPDARILLHDAGMFAWDTSFSLVDIVGLKTPSSIAAHEKFTLPTAGQNRSAAVDEIASKGDVTHAIILNDFFWGQLPDDLRAAGWALTPIREPDGFGYVVYSISKPDADN